MTNIPDSQYMARSSSFTEWKPEAYVDHHHMGGNGARIFLPPYAEPVRPFADPILWRELSWYGAHMATRRRSPACPASSITPSIPDGVTSVPLDHALPQHCRHAYRIGQCAPRLASVRHPDQLRGNTRNLPVYEQETIFRTVAGGWWQHCAISSERQKVSAWATLDLAARNARDRTVERIPQGQATDGARGGGKPGAYLVSLAQHDPLTARRW